LEHIGESVVVQKNPRKKAEFGGILTTKKLGNQNPGGRVSKKKINAS